MKKREKEILENVQAVEYYDNFADEYDYLANKFHWISPKIMFGLLYEYAIHGKKLLDVGIGTGLSSIPFFKQGMEVHGIDGSESMLRYCADKGICTTVSKCNLEKDIFNFDNNYFDLVISNGVSYFIENIDHYLSESLRVLKIGGVFCFNYEHFVKNSSDNMDFSNAGVASYRNFSNCVISKKLKEKTGVTVFKYSTEFIKKKLFDLNIDILEEIMYYAYTSPSTNEDVYFTLLILKK